MLNEIVTPVSAAIIISCITVVARHIMNADKHPDKKELVPHSECDARHKGLDDCIESKITALHDKIDIFRKDVKGEFRSMRDLIQNKKL